jgi:cell division protein ZapE
MDAAMDDACRRFIELVDELYDRNVNLIVSSATQPEMLYVGTRLAEPFLRTASRLNEMRSRTYLSKPHLP